MYPMGGGMSLAEKFRKLILLNEHSGSTQKLYCFSDPDGQNGRSGWSFGLCQFDISHNPLAATCLKECNFSTAEIEMLKSQTYKDMLAADLRLAAHYDIIDRYDTAQLADCLRIASDMAHIGKWSYIDDKALLYAADYHNQMCISHGGEFYRYCKRIGTVTAGDIYSLRLNQKWGQKRKDDVDRRFRNLLKVCREG